ncbi:diguanylate cyclase response regulator [Pokkaliibacter plantistimulans]|uniref:diguanylate cyclase n=1 Tax=Proteobacteria bacterium 228 TaxID=2083153 RepID=A0A2S5KLB6_9PROT|nr:diguanylate cyclase [Pokkaliibacter plantistimulans]PPC75621.1 diguanylate cyclase response regulator [Pokkaliibacter plantistimulans]
MTDVFEQEDELITVDQPVMVLLVDDQAIIAEAVRRALATEFNIDLHFCSNAEHAIDQAIEIKPTVILQDLVMPSLDGLSLVRAYRAHPATRDIPIIVLSTKEEPKIKSAAFAAGANDYLVKLPDAIELIARIRYHSRSYQALQQRDEAYRALRQSQQQLLEANLVLQRLTHSDGLTALSNRRHFDDHLEGEWRRAHRDQTSLSLLMIDIDYFKRFNDQFGHIAGDEALQRVANCIGESCSRPHDLAARYGGEEFALILPSTSVAGVKLIAEKVRRQVEKMAIPHVAPSENSVVTVSIGASSIVPKEARPARLLVALADRALYEAKTSGKNRVVFRSQEDLEDGTLDPGSFN